MESLHVINQRLKDIYGSTVTGEAKYRVVWTTNEREARVMECTPSGIELARPIIVPDCAKYPAHPDMWALEFKFETGYEPLWIIYDTNGNYLDYDWEVLTKIVYFHIHKQPPKTQSMIDHAIEEAKKKEEVEVLDYLRHDEAFPDKMYDTPVVTVPKNYKEH